MELKAVFQMRVMMGMKVMTVIVIITMEMMQDRWLTMLNMKTFICLITKTFKSNQKFEATVIKQIKIEFE